MGLNFFRYRKTSFESGGLLEDIKPREEQSSIIVPSQFIAPRRIDSRDMCLSSSNQYQTPHCAGYATAGYIEYRNWKTKHFPQQVDGDMIYSAAKQIDKNNSDGTNLRSAIQGAINLHLINGEAKFVEYTEVDSMNLPGADGRMMALKFALHEYGVCIAGFRITDEWDWVDKSTGIIRDLGSSAKQKGGHAVLLCGYDHQGLYIQNSWGEGWGHAGFAILGWAQAAKQLMVSMVIHTV